MNATLYSCVAVLSALLLWNSNAMAYEVTSVTIINPATDVAIATVSDGDVLDMDVLPNKIAFRADTDSTTASVEFQISGAISHSRIDNVLPFSSHGDASGDYEGFLLRSGSYTLNVTPWQYGGATGASGPTVTINFTASFDPSPVAPSVGTGPFQEIGGLVIMETESNAAAGDWSFRTNNAGYTGDGFYTWKFGDVSTSITGGGSGVITYEVDIATTGRYRFKIRSAAPEQSDHNDVWVRFPDNGAEAVKGSGGFSLGTGWFKIYQNEDDNEWTWNTVTKDFDPHQIFADFDSPGTYRIELSGRSTLFQIDRIALYHSSVSGSVAEDVATPESPRVGAPPVACPTPQNPTINFTGATTIDASYDPVTGADGYQIQGRPFGATAWVNRYSFSTSNSFSGLNEGQTYEWRVRAACNGLTDTSEYTIVQSFTMPTLRKVYNWDLEVFPNPVSANSVLNVNAPENTSSMQLIDVHGRQIQAWSVAEGMQQLTLDNLANGIYVLRAVRADGKAIQFTQVSIAR